MSLFSTTIKVPVSTLQEYAEKLQSYAEENEDVFDGIYNSLLCLKGSGEWKGKSLTSAANATRRNKEKFKDAVSELNALAEFLKKFADAMAEKDADIKKDLTSNVLAAYVW